MPSHCQFVIAFTHRMLPILEHLYFFPKPLSIPIAVRIFSRFKTFYPFFLSQSPTPNVWYSHLASGLVRPSDYPSAQVLWQLDFPIHPTRFCLSRVVLRTCLESHVIPSFGPPPEPSAAHAIRIRPNSLLTFIIFIPILSPSFKAKKKS